MNIQDFLSFVRILLKVIDFILYIINLQKKNNRLSPLKLGDYLFQKVIKG